MGYFLSWRHRRASLASLRNGYYFITYKGEAMLLRCNAYIIEETSLLPLVGRVEVTTVGLSCYLANEEELG